MGPNTVSVSAAGIEDGVTFTAEAVATPPPSTATTLVKISGDNQQGVINAALANPFIVEVRDQEQFCTFGDSGHVCRHHGRGDAEYHKYDNRYEWEGIKYSYPWGKCGVTHRLRVCRRD